MLIPQARIAPAANQAAPAVLLVNDDPGALFALRSVLGDLDADLVTASSGEQALLRLLKQDFCVILMDVKMAGLDGFETARLVRARPRSRATPIVFLTSHRASDLDRSRGFEVGASDYVFMPVAPEVLKAKVQAFLDGAPERRPVRALAPGARGEAADAGIERLILEHAGDYVALLDPAGAWLYTSPSYRAEFGAAVGPGARYLEIVHVDDRERVRALVVTGLPNRLLLLDRLGQATAQRERQRAQVAVLFLDLDHFKEINDGGGHEAGDVALQLVAERARASLRAADCMARLGGDEFAVLLPDTTLAQACTVGEKLQAELRQLAATLVRHAGQAPLTLSIGVTATQADEPFKATLARADAALYAAKSAGRDKVIALAPQLQPARPRRAG